MIPPNNFTQKMNSKMIYFTLYCCSNEQHKIFLSSYNFLFVFPNLGVVLRREADARCSWSVARATGHQVRGLEQNCRDKKQFITHLENLGKHLRRWEKVLVGCKNMRKRASYWLKILCLYSASYVSTS